MASAPTKVSQDRGREVQSANQAVQRTVSVTPERAAAASEPAIQASAEIFQIATTATQRSINQLTGVLGLTGDGAQNAVHRSSRNWDAMMQCGTALVEGGQDISRAWLDCAQGNIRHSMDGFDRLLGCRTLMDFIAVQSDILRQSMEDMVQNRGRLSELSAQVTRTAAERCCLSPR